MASTAAACPRGQAGAGDVVALPVRPLPWLWHSPGPCSQGCSCHSWCFPRSFNKRDFFFPRHEIIHWKVELRNNPQVRATLDEIPTRVNEALEAREKKLKLNTESLKQCKFCSLSFSFLKKNPMFGEGFDHFAEKSTQRPAPGSTEGHHQAMLSALQGDSWGGTEPWHHTQSPAPRSDPCPMPWGGSREGFGAAERRTDGEKGGRKENPTAQDTLGCAQPLPWSPAAPLGGSSSGTPTSSWVWGDTRVKPRLPALPHID